MEGEETNRLRGKRCTREGCKQMGQMKPESHTQSGRHEEIKQKRRARDARTGSKIETSMGSRDRDIKRMSRDRLITSLRNQSEGERNQTYMF